MPDHAQASERRRSTMWVGVIGAAALLAFLILNGHGDHLLSLVPLLILLACPLMHMFMHHGHGHHGEGDGPRSVGPDGRAGR